MAEEEKGTDGSQVGELQPSSEADWRTNAEEHLNQRLKRRIALARKSQRLDLADPRSSLRELWLTNHAFSTIPEVVASMPCLTTLCMSGNRLTSLTAPLFKCVRLERLLLARNELVALPPEFEELAQLREVRLGSNHLSRFPVSLTKLRNLRRLDLCHNNITSVPPRIRRLTNLIELDLDNNRIGPELPPEILRLSSLQVLGVANNCLEACPELHKRVAGALPMAVFRVSGNRSGKYKVYHDSGVLLEGQNIPKRADGYLELRKGYMVTDLDGESHRRVEELEGYLTDGYRFNVASANWHRGADEYKVLKARARKRQMRKAVHTAEAAALEADTIKRRA